VTAGLALLVYTLIDANDAGWGSPQTLGLGALSLVLLAAFVVIELRRRYPLIPFSIFKLRTLRGSNIIGLLLGMSLFAMFFFISLYMQQVLGYDPLKAGLAYLPLAGLIIVSAGGASQLVARFGFKPVLIVGLLFTAAGLFWFSRVSAPGGTYVGDVLFPSMLAAVGLGLSFVPVTIGSVTGTKPSEAGLASGLINTSQQVGGALGLAVLATIATTRTDDVLASGVQNQAVALTEGFQDAFFAGGIIALVGALLAAVMISTRDSREMAEVARSGEAPPAAIPA
jgi:MFS family permease